LTVKLVAGHGAGASGSSGRDALMPPRLEDGLRDGRVPGDRGRSGGQAPARAHPAAGAPAGGGWGPGTWVRLPGATEPCPPSRWVIRVSGENARTPAVLVGCAGALCDRSDGS